MRPRRQQTPITIRSDRVAERLAQFRAAGRSQVEVIEEAVEALPLPKPDSDIEQRFAELKQLIAKIPKGSIISIKEFDALEYDENGDLR